jgi:hypothetical protein
MEGGCGGFSYINSLRKNVYGRNGDKNHGGKNLLPGDKVKEFLVKKGLYEEWKDNISSSLKEKYKTNKFHWIGKKHTEETKKKIGYKSKISQSGSKNSQFGTKWAWMSKDEKVIKIKLNLREDYIAQGWVSGIKRNK